MVIYLIILVIVKHFVIFQILRMYIMLCQPFCFMSFSFFYKSVCILQVIIGGVLFRQGIILISVHCSFNTLKVTTLALIKIINRCLSLVGTLQSFLLGFLYLKLNFYI